MAHLLANGDLASLVLSVVSVPFVALIGCRKIGAGLLNRAKRIRQLKTQL
ncbi:hypothetical protein NKDENANG_04035 [Candidatus Entotheonellaceae bacterium PAL068K]